MNKRSKLLSAALLGLWCLSLLVGTLQAASPEKLRDLKPEEVRNIERALPTKATVKPAKPRKLLVFWRCEGFYHRSIPVGNKALELMGKKTGAYDVVVTDDYSVFTKRNLRQFDAICLNNTTGLKFDPKETPERCEPTTVTTKAQLLQSVTGFPERRLNSVKMKSHYQATDPEKCNKN